MRRAQHLSCKTQITPLLSQQLLHGTYYTCTSLGSAPSFHTSSKSHGLHSGYVFQPTLICCMDPTSFRWCCLSLGQASQVSPCLDAPDHQTNTVICLPISISVRLQSCSSISSTASYILKIFCLEPQGEWLPNSCHDFANGEKKNPGVRQLSWNLAENHLWQGSRTVKK